MGTDVVAVDKQLHSVHPYPCKFPSATVREYLKVSGRTVMDPFCGSGTTLLEAAMHGNNIAGVDVNPVAVMISKAKLARLGHDEVEYLAQFGKRVASTTSFKGCDLPDFHGKEHWFSKGARESFGYLRNEVDMLGRDSDAWNVAATALSALVNKFSNQDTETRYARVDREIDPLVVTKAFRAKLDSFLVGLNARGCLDQTLLQNIVLGDIRTDAAIKPNTVDLVITSPPYANTMDYYLYHKQRMNVLGFNFKEAQNQEIGSRYEFSSKKAPKEKWDEDYLEALKSVYSKLKKGGRAIYVIGDSQIAGEMVDGGLMTMRLGELAGFSAKILESVSMTGKSKLFNHNFQSKNKFEHTVELVK